MKKNNRYVLIVVLIMALLMLFEFIIIKLPPDLHWKYTRNQVNELLIYSSDKDSLRNAIDGWYITQEPNNVYNSTQKEIDSIENVITRLIMKQGLINEIKY